MGWDGIGTRGATMYGLGRTIDRRASYSVTEGEDDDVFPEQIFAKNSEEYEIINVYKRVFRD